MIRVIALTVLVLPALSACLTLSDAPARPVAAPVETPAVSAQAPSGDRQNDTALAARSPAPQREPSYPDIDTLKGEMSVQITSLLGQPDFRRTDKPAQLWQYRHEACSVDLFLYPADSGALTVDHLDVRNFGEGSLSRQACFVAILKSRSAGNRG